MTSANPRAEDMVNLEISARELTQSGLSRWWLRATHLILSAMLFVVYLAAQPVWKLSTRLYEILFERGPWQYVTITLACLAIVDLVLKLLVGLAGRFRAEMFQWSDPLQVKDLQHSATQLSKLHLKSPLMRITHWPHRIALGLLQYARGDSKSSIRETMQVQAQADEAALASRYTFVKLFLWAIPLVGFIGTVEGIGAGIGEFSRNLETQTSQPTGQELAAPPPDRMDGVRKSLQNVTAGLGRAFDTTYLALVLTIALMLWMSAVEKWEQDQLGQVDDFCHKEFVGRIPDAPQHAPTVVNLAAPADAGRLANDLDAHLAKVATHCESVTENCDLLAQRCNDVDQMVKEVSSVLGKDGLTLKLSLGDGKTATARPDPKRS